MTTEDNKGIWIGYAFIAGAVVVFAVAIPVVVHLLSRLFY